MSNKIAISTGAYDILIRMGNRTSYCCKYDTNIVKEIHRTLQDELRIQMYTPTMIQFTKGPSKNGG